MSGIFRSFFQAGFECSTHRRRAGRKRLDVLAATQHDLRAADDYRLIQSLGMRTAREGFRWHRIEQSPGIYDWSSALPLLRAARETETQVIWDLLHYGWPDDIDILSPGFVERFARFCGAAARLVRDETVGPTFYCPVNEISFFAWAAGEVGAFFPFMKKRGDALKTQLVKASIAAVAAIREADPAARIVQIDPVIRVLPDPDNPRTAARARAHNQAQFDAFDMLLGRLRPELGGHDGCIDIVGLNYYCHNQWYVNRGPLPWDGGDPAYTPLEELLKHHFSRYGRPVLIAETGIEAELRPSWLAHVCASVRAAMQAGVPVEGICLYPAMNHPGWDDDRHCPCGLIDYDRSTFARSVHQPLADELARQMRLFDEVTPIPAMPIASPGN